MSSSSSSADVNIHIRARSQDRSVIDQAAELLGTNRSRFMLGLALKEAKNILLDQTVIHGDQRAFQKILDWMEAPPDPEEAAGIICLMATKAPWETAGADDQ